MRRLEGEAKLVDRRLQATVLGLVAKCRQAGTRSKKLPSAVAVARVAHRQSARARKRQKEAEAVAEEEPNKLQLTLRIRAEAAARQVANPLEKYTGRRFPKRLRELGLECKEFCRKALQERSSYNTP
mmetsp:Transcript_75758/g.119651  ORF Transcript_75758/g.119651 Transcript_75758/m.119651 type:complete len:127 (-) Transcript_75758:37-417(-)